MFDAAPFSWEDPLSAKSYAVWHDQLPAKRDQVEAIDRDDSAGVGVYVIRTSTSASTLRTATLTLRARDLRPIREMLEFTSETVEITDVPQASGNEVAETPAKPGPGTARTPARVTEPRTAPSMVGQKLLIVSSGAVALGRRRLALKRRRFVRCCPTSVPGCTGLATPLRNGAGARGRLGGDQQQ